MRPDRVRWGQADFPLLIVVILIATIESSDLSAGMDFLIFQFDAISRLLPATPERVANRVQLLPHFSIARLQRLCEEEGCVA